MRNIGLVFDFEFKAIIRKKTFIVTTIIFCLIAFAAILIPTYILKNEEEESQIHITETENGIINEGEEHSKIADIFGQAGFYLSEKAEKSLSDYPLLNCFANSYKNVDDLKAAIQLKEINFAVIFDSNIHYELLINGEKQEDAYDIIQQSLTEYNKAIQAKHFDIAPQFIPDVYNVNAIGETTDIQAKKSGNIILGTVYTIIMYMMIIMYGSTVSTSVAREKDNRTMEVLIANTKPDYLIIGKSLAAGLAGIMQMITLILSAWIAIQITDTNIMGLLQTVHLDLDLTTILTMIFFGITGYLLYLFIYAGLGAMVSKIEDINYAVTPVTLLFASGYIIAFAAMHTPNSLLYRVFSMVPFTSVLVMPMRSLLVFVPIWEIVLSVGILLFSIVLFSYLAIRIYRLGTLNYGNRMKFIPTMKLIFKGEDR